MKSWLISNCNEKTIAVKTGAIFKTHPLCLSSKFLLHEVSREKESQCIVKERLLKILKTAHLFFCKVIEIFMILF